MTPNFPVCIAGGRSIAGCEVTTRAKLSHPVDACTGGQHVCFVPTRIRVEMACYRY